MRLGLIRRWAHAPWHAWLNEHVQWRELLATLFARLPESALRSLVLTTRPLVMLPPPRAARIVRLNQPLWRGANILQLDDRLLERPADEALGILAHELAHLCVGAPTADALKNDLAADRVAMGWGFRKELLLALQRDLSSSHPRVVAAGDRLSA